ncbi:MAG: hypothetical protein ACLR8Y_17220 [Alistipes indistinctus]
MQVRKRHASRPAKSRATLGRDAPGHLPEQTPRIDSIILTQSPALMGFCTSGVKLDVRTIPWRELGPSCRIAPIVTVPTASSTKTQWRFLK